MSDRFVDIVVALVLVAVPTILIGLGWWWLWSQGIVTWVPVGAGVLWVIWLPIGAFLRLIHRDD